MECSIHYLTITKIPPYYKEHRINVINVIGKGEKRDGE